MAGGWRGRPRRPGRRRPGDPDQSRGGRTASRERVQGDGALAARHPQQQLLHGHCAVPRVRRRLDQQVHHGGGHVVPDAAVGDLPMGVHHPGVPCRAPTGAGELGLPSVVVGGQGDTNAFPAAGSVKVEAKDFHDTSRATSASLTASPETRWTPATSQIPSRVSCCRPKVAPRSTWPTATARYGSRPAESPLLGCERQRIAGPI